MLFLNANAGNGNNVQFQCISHMHDIEIFIKDPLPPVIDADFIFKYIASILPAYLMTEVDIVYVGQFEDLKKREVNAIFEDGAIFVTNEQSSEMDLIDDIVHEIAHSIEKKYVDRIYGDGSLEREFKRKRRKLYDTLKQKGKNPPPELITNIHYSQAVDDYFFRVVGYSVLGQISAFEKLFTGPYSATSIREYFATGFDQYFCRHQIRPDAQFDHHPGDGFHHLGRGSR